MMPTQQLQHRECMVEKPCFADVVYHARSGYRFGSGGDMMPSEHVESYARNDESQCTSPVLKCGVSDFGGLAWVCVEVGSVAWITLMTTTRA